MDPSLLKECDGFKKRALLNLDVKESKKRENCEISKKSKNISEVSKKIKLCSQKSKIDDYKSYSGASLSNFSVLAKIIKHMKQRHLNGDNYSLTFDEILDETNLLNVTKRQRHWLNTEALINNPKIDVTSDGKYIFKPPYNIKNRKGLINLLDKHDQRDLGGIYYDDIEESIPNAKGVVKSFGDNVIIVIQPASKKKVLFYNDKTFQFNVDEEFVKLWRGVSVNWLDDIKIESYLQKQGIVPMKDLSTKKPIPQRRFGKGPNNRNFKKLNQHMNDVLEYYSEND